MKISKLRLAWEYLWSGMGGVVDYLLGLLNSALDSIDPDNKQKIQGALNVAEVVLSALSAFQWLCPVKWQTAYRETIEAVVVVVSSLSDLSLTKTELDDIRKEFFEAMAAWKGPDDDTCVAPSK